MPKIKKPTKTMYHIKPYSSLIINPLGSSEVNISSFGAYINRVQELYEEHTKLLEKKRLHKTKSTAWRERGNVLDQLVVDVSLRKVKLDQRKVELDQRKVELDRRKVNEQDEAANEQLSKEINQLSKEIIQLTEETKKNTEESIQLANEANQLVNERTNLSKEYRDIIIKFDIFKKSIIDQQSIKK